MKTFALAAVAFLVAASPATAAPPPNDNFADAMKVGIGQEYSGDLTEATAELGEPAHGLEHANQTVWFRYRSPRRANLTVDASGQDIYNLVAVYTGGDVASLESVATDADFDGIIRFRAKKRVTYRIAIDTWPSDSSPTPYTLWLSDGGIKGKGVAMTVDPGQSVDSVRAKGLRLHITARRKVGMAVKLRVSRATAKRLGLRSGVLGRTRGTIDYGQALAATITLKPAARKALRDVHSLKAKVQLTLPRTTAPDRSLTARVVL